MKQSVTIIGAGITGLTIAHVLNHLDPSLRINLIDAGAEPEFGRGDNNNHHGATLGRGRDARHFTGTEGLSFQNPVHTKLLFESAGPRSPGWLTMPESSLSAREKHWRDECLDRFKQHVTPEHNPYDQMYTALNYGGMAAWELLARLDPAIRGYRLGEDHVLVAFENDQTLQADFETESSFNPFQPDDPVMIVDARSALGGQVSLDFGQIAPKLLKVPGSAWRIQSIWRYYYQRLVSLPNVQFEWSKVIEKADQLPDSDYYVWAAGPSYATPQIYSDHGRVQGIGGWWLSLPNPGIKVPIKFSAPQPTGYINITPEGDAIHISGGFGWVGERSFDESERLLAQSRKHFLYQVGRLFGVDLKADVAECCIRPTTPTGLPDVKILNIGGKEHVMVSGAGKAGSTQASLLALYVAERMGMEASVRDIVDKEPKAHAKVIKRGLDLLERGLEP